MATPEAARRRSVARAAAEPYGGVLSRSLLREIGIDRNVVGREVAADRWRLWGRHTVAVHTGPLGARALVWRAIWEVGSGIAVADGVSALHVGGLVGYEDSTIHISIAHGRHAPDVEGVTIHRVRRQTGEIVGAGVPRTRPVVAALRAAHWAPNDRQAALVLAMTVQQRLVPGTRLIAATDHVRGRARRSIIQQFVRDIADGAHSLGELDFTRLCRLRGLPEPSRQVVRRGPHGRIYLDAAWEDVGLSVEIDGAQHHQGLAMVDDNLRQNAITLGGEMVLRIGVMGLRIAEDAFMSQVVEAYWSLVGCRIARGSER